MYKSCATVMSMSDSFTDMKHWEETQVYSKVKLVAFSILLINAFMVWYNSLLALLIGNIKN